ncbi:MAG: hypothetical protein ACLTW9_22455 [Enterocloster sp.]
MSLTGIIAGLIAIGMEEGRQRCLGVYLHGQGRGRGCLEEPALHSLLASELADAMRR